MTFKKIILQIHRWLGLSSGLVVFVVSLTGCIYVFESEIRSLYEYPFTRVVAKDQPVLPVSQLYTVGKAALEGQFQKPLQPEYQNVTLYPNPEKSAYYYAYSKAEKVYHYVYLNPYSGEVLKVKNMHSDFFHFVLELHVSLLLPHKIGHQIVGAAVLIFVVSLITGLVLWFPKSTKGMKQRFTVKWNARWRRRNYDLHNVLGFYALPIALIVALTGLTWSYDWFQHGVDWLANGGHASAEVQTPQPDFSAPVGTTTIDAIFQESSRRYPESKMFTIDFPKNDSVGYVLGFYPSLKTYYDAALLTFDQRTGALLHTDDFATKTNGQKLQAMNYDIHIGKILGFPGQLLAFLAGLVAASLPVTGFLIWRGRRKKALKPAKTAADTSTQNEQLVTKTKATT